MFNIPSQFRPAYGLGPSLFVIFISTNLKRNDRFLEHRHSVDCFGIEIITCTPLLTPVCNELGTRSTRAISFELGSPCNLGWAYVNYRFGIEGLLYSVVCTFSCLNNESIKATKIPPKKPPRCTEIATLGIKKVLINPMSNIMTVNRLSLAEIRSKYRTAKNVRIPIKPKIGPEDPEIGIRPS